MKGVVHHSNACDKQSADHGTIERLVSVLLTFLSYKNNTTYSCMHFYLYSLQTLTDTATHPLPSFTPAQYLPSPPFHPRFDPEMNQFVKVAKFNRVRRYIHHCIYSICIYPLPSYHEPFSDMLHCVYLDVLCVILFNRGFSAAASEDMKIYVFGGRDGDQDLTTW